MPKAKKQAAMNDADVIEVLRQKFKLSSPPNGEFERIPTGTPVDWLIGGGFPLRAFTILYGQKSSGKTTLAIHTAANLQKMNGIVIWVDNENSFSADYVTRLGVDIPKVIYSIGLTKEETFDLMANFAEAAKDKQFAGRKFLFVWDSVAAAPSQLELDAAFNQTVVGAGARALSLGFRKLSPIMSDFPNITYLIINQVRENLNNRGWGSSDDGMYGGNALEHWASLFLHFKKIKTLADISGSVVRVKITKSKISKAPVYKSIDLVVRYSKGVDVPLTLFELAKTLRLVEPSGGWYRWKDKAYRVNELVTKIIPNDKEFQERVEREWKQRNGILDLETNQEVEEMGNSSPPSE